MQQEFSKSLKLMGNIFTITVVTDSIEIANENFQVAIQEIQRIEQVFTTYNDKSETNLINNNAGIVPVKVSKEMFDLIERSIHISTITQGAFDLSYGGIDKKLWNFDQSLTELPSKEIALQAVHLINYQNIILDKNMQTVFLKEKGMRIGFGGIGKGYAAEMAKKRLIANKIKSGIINASGDLTTWGCQANGNPWTIGIANPNQPKSPFSYLNISNKAVATSGNYEKFVIIGGKKYSHTINPKTGLPISGIKSVTIIGDNAELADAMATPIAVMGIKNGLFLINQIPNLYCVIIDDYNKIYTSNNINLK